MVRTIVDHAIFSPERLLFEAAPKLQEGLVKKHTEPIMCVYDDEFLDLSELKPLTDSEEKEYLKIVRQLKGENEKSDYVVKSREQFFEHRKQLYAKSHSESDQSIKDIENDYQRLLKRELLPDSTIILEKNEVITVQNILDNPMKYNEQCCYDPYEPDYGKGNIAKVYSNQDVPIIKSFAHGNNNYYLPINKKEPDFYNKSYQLEHFYLVRYQKKNEIYHIFDNQIQKFSIDGFKNTFNPYKISVGDEKVCAAKWWLGTTKKKVFFDESFSPGKPIVFKGRNGLYLNEYVPEIERYNLPVPSEAEAENGASKWIEHIFHMIQNKEEAEILIQWFAYLIQQPYERPKWSPMVTSQTRGTGKDRIAELFTRIIGAEYFTNGEVEEISNGGFWGDIFYRKKLIIFSECGSDKGRYQVGNTIKDSITTESMTMNLKHGKHITERVYGGMIFFSNFNRPFKFDEGDRRFFCSRCNWSKEYTDKLKVNGYFDKLSKQYDDEQNVNGLYHYLKNYNITIDCLGDAPETELKKFMMESEISETEQFFIDLKNHPCKYWTASMIENLFDNEFGTNKHIDNKEYKYHLRNKLESAGSIKINGKTFRIKCFGFEDSQKDRQVIKQNIDENWNKTTKYLNDSVDKNIHDNRYPF